MSLANKKNVYLVHKYVLWSKVINVESVFIAPKPAFTIYKPWNDERIVCDTGFNLLFSWECDI